MTQTMAHPLQQVAPSSSTVLVRYRRCCHVSSCFSPYHGRLGQCSLMFLADNTCILELNIVTYMQNCQGTHICMCVCMYVCVHVCMYAYMYVCMLACMYVYVQIYMAPPSASSFRKLNGIKIILTKNWSKVVSAVLRLIVSVRSCRSGHPHCAIHTVQSEPESTMSLSGYSGRTPSPSSGGPGRPWYLIR
jgi:hypothetical protein